MIFRVLAPALVLGVLLLAVPATAKAELPQWGVGDFWQYEGQDLNATDPHNRSERIEVVGLDEYVDGRSRPDVPRALEVLQTDSADGGTPTTTRYWLRVSDHAIAKITQVPSAGNISLIEEIHTPPFDVYQFPLEAGDEFTATSVSQVFNDGFSLGIRTSNIPVNVTGEREVTARVGGASRTFSCLVVRQGDGYGLGYSLLYYNDDVGQWVRQEHYARPNASVPEEKDLELTLTAYRYGPSVLPIVAVGVIAVLAVVTAVLVWRGRRSSTPRDDLPDDGPPKRM